MNDGIFMEKCQNVRVKNIEIDFDPMSESSSDVKMSYVAVILKEMSLSHAMTKTTKLILKVKTLSDKVIR